MSIKCQICNTEFEKIIPWQHLRTHNISTADYKLSFGEVYSPETLAKHAARIPHNKGKKVTDPEQLANFRAAIQSREEKFKRGEFKRGGAKTEEQKKVLSEKQTAYASNNPEKMKERTQKAVQTKISNGYDFGSAMRGKSQTEHSKQRSKETAIKNNTARRDKSFNEATEKLKALGVEITTIEDVNAQLHCTICGTEFSITYQYLMPSKFKDTLCPVCNPRNKPVSNKETQLYEYVKSLCPDAIQSYRKTYHSKEIDIYVPSKNLGIEFNGLYWHSEEVSLANNRSPKHTYEKMLWLNESGIRIINIFEDEWDLQQAIVKSRLRSILGKVDIKVGARQCSSQKISAAEAAKFCKDHHIMGSGRSNANYGLYYNGELVSVMTFTKSNLSRKVVDWELNRFCSKQGIIVVGAANKLFSMFITEFSPDKVISYSDNRWSNGSVYETLGFVCDTTGTPNYWYIKDNLPGRIHRFTLRKQSTDAKDISERQLRLNEGYRVVWDCGSSKWVWHR